jgi:hypothetical protein
LFLVGGLIKLMPVRSTIVLFIWKQTLADNAATNDDTTANNAAVAKADANDAELHGGDIQGDISFSVSWGVRKEVLSFKQRSIE